MWKQKLGLLQVLGIQRIIRRMRGADAIIKLLLGTNRRTGHLRTFCLCRHSSKYQVLGPQLQWKLLLLLPQYQCHICVRDSTWQPVLLSKPPPPATYHLTGVLFLYAALSWSKSWMIGRARSHDCFLAAREAGNWCSIFYFGKVESIRENHTNIERLFRRRWTMMNMTNVLDTQTLL